jgi:HlyD family secretion protein
MPAIKDFTRTATAPPLAAPAADGAAPPLTPADEANGTNTRRWESSMVRRRRLVLGAAGAAVLILVALAVRPTPVDVETRSVLAGPLETLVRAEGVARVQDRFEITAPIHGRAERLLLREGDVVRAGDVLARIAPPPLDPQNVAQAQAQLTAALAGAAEAAARLAQAGDAFAQSERSTARLRAVAAAEPGAISPDALEQAETRLAAASRERDAALARQRVANAGVDAARAALIGTPASAGPVMSVRATANGTVLRVHQPSERIVAAGTPLLQIGDPAALEIVVDVLSTDAVRIRPGAPVRLLDWGGAEVLNASVRLVEPAGFTRTSALGVEEQRVNVIADLLETAGPLGDGYRVQAEIITWASPRVVKVFNSALFRTGGEWSVFVVRDGRARTQHVRIGHRGLTEAEVLDGLEADDVVIVFPSDRVAEGVRVRAMNR